MPFRSIVSGALALLMSAVVVQARDLTPQPGAHTVPVPRLDMRRGFGVGGASFFVAQAESDPRVVALEEQIRSLNGTLEELNFQVLQLQEQIRKLQEDNEFRFQELEKKSDARGPKSDKSPAADNVAVATPPKADAPASVEDVIVSDQSTAEGANGTQPMTIGSVTFDADGNVIGGKVDPAAPAADGTVVASLPDTADPEELYRNSYEFILSGDYGTAEAGFRGHIARFPDNSRAADVKFWLGESLLGQKKYRDAAEVFLAANKDYPKAKKAPDMLLKLGVSLVGLNQRDVACATFGEVAKRYPQASTALKERVKQERALAGC